MELEKALDPDKKPLGTPDPLPRPKSKTEEFESPVPANKIGAPTFLPPAERKHYDKIQGLRTRFLRRLRSAWNDFKKSYLATIEKQKLSRDQRSIFDTLLGNFNDIGSEAFDQGIKAGNSYFEDQFSVKGLTAAQQRKVLRQHNSVFGDRIQSLFMQDVQDRLEETPPGQEEKLLNSFDRFLLGYSAVAASIAYDVFSRNITVLNKNLRRSLGPTDAVFFPPDVTLTKWVLFDDAEHSADCVRLSEGESGKGDGIWNSEVLSEMGMVPQSPNLDCGGNCRCHLSPIVQAPRALTSWITNVVAAPRQRNILEVKSDVSQSRLLAVFAAKRFIIPSRFADDLVSKVSLRRNGFWNKYPNEGIVYNVTQGNKFQVGGSTFIDEVTGKVIKTEVNVTLGRGQTISSLSKVEVNEVTRIFTHELGHSFASIGSSRVNPISLGAHGLDAADEILSVARRERLRAFAKIESNFDDVIKNIPKDRLAELKPVIDTARNFMRNPDEFVDDLFKAVEAGGEFGGVPAQDAWQLLNRALNEFTTNTNLISSYQLWDEGEYFAEWFALLINDPAKAALFSPDLNRAMAKRFPVFFKTVGVKRAKEVIPDAIAATFRSDLPLGSGFVSVGPNLKSLGGAAVKFRTGTKRVSNSTVQRQVSKVIRDNVNLHREEFYGGLNVRFLDRLQVGKRSGSRRNLAFFDKGQFNINYDRWRLLSDDNKSSLIADIVARHVYKKAKPSVRRSIKAEYSDYLSRTFDVLENKAGIQNLAKRPIQDIRDITLGNRSKNISKNLGFWGRNFEDSIKPTLKNITDLPVANIDSLASPRAFWGEWMKLYVTNPEASGIYGPAFKGILEDFLRTSPLRKFINFLIGGNNHGI